MIDIEAHQPLLHSVGWRAKNKSGNGCERQGAYRFLRLNPPEQKGEYWRTWAEICCSFFFCLRPDSPTLQKASVVSFKVDFELRMLAQALQPRSECVASKCG